jgi:hypothetical protein
MTFSLPGLLISLAFLAPNLLLIVARPHGSTRLPDAAPGWLVALERVGQAGCLVAPVLTGAAVAGILSAVALALAGAAVLAYWALWVRYLRARRVELLFEPFRRIPVPMAILPVTGFLLTALALSSWWVAAAALVLAVAHIPVSLLTARALAAGAGPETGPGNGNGNAAGSPAA